MKTPEEIIKATEQYYFLPEGSIKGDRRFPEICKARHVAMYLLRKYGYSANKAGRALNRHHSSILSGCQNINEKTYPGVMKEMDEIIDLLDSNLVHDNSIIMVTETGYTVRLPSHRKYETAVV